MTKRKEYLKKYNKNYRSSLDFNEKKKIYDRRYYIKHREEILKKNKDYMKGYKNREQSKISNRKSSEKWRLKNPIKSKKIMASYFKKRYNNDPIFNLRTKLRARFFQALELYIILGKIKKSKMLQINHEAIIEHLKPFPEDLSDYHVDHIKPLCSFDFTNEEEIREAFAPENHQWLTIQENLSKGGRL